MASTHAPNTRAHLLAGLRTGGVRSASGPIGNVPHTASPAGSFNIHQYSGMVPNDSVYGEEEDELADMVSQNMYISNNVSRMQQPMTAAVDGAANRFAQQQSMGYNGINPMNAYMNQQNQMQAMQLQLMQMELARLQTMQAQQYQAELLAQAQRQQRQAQPQRRSTMGYALPATAGPLNTTFDAQRNALGPQARRVNQADQLRAKLGVASGEQVPMTAALGGRFGSRFASGQYESDEDEFTPYPKTSTSPNFTSVLSGGATLGHNSHNNAPSKSDAAVSWRRGTENHSMLNGNRAVTSPMVKITPPPIERPSPSPISSPVKTRPPALQFTAAVSQPINVVAVDNEANDGDDSSSVSSKSGSAPSTPRTSSSLGDAPPLSPREEASKKLYEGLGLGRAVPSITVTVPPSTIQRFAAMPVRQPLGPPSSNDELRPKNFASRSRRKAIGALGALLDARVSREAVEAY